MRKSLIAIAAGLMTLSTVSAQAATIDQNHSTQTRPAEQGQSNNQNNNQNQGRGEHRDSYGTWQSAWGARPAAPPAHFSRKSDWYRHVRACQSRYRTYNAHTDRYVPRRGQTAVCRL